MGLVQVIIDESSSRIIAGTYEFDRASGGVLICPSGASFPSDPVIGEWFWRTDESKLYRYDGTAWQATAADVSAHAATHESGGADEINVNGLSGVLVDDQPAQVHALGGAKHSVDTLANLNAKISDATLDDAGSPRPPTAHKSTHEVSGADALEHQNLSGAGTNTHAQLDSHVASTSNPHSVTKAQVGLGNVTNDAQLKRAANDFAAFPEKSGFDKADLLLVEDSAAAGEKKKVQLGNLLVFGSEYQYGFDESESTTTSSSWQQKYRFTTSNLPSGTYRIGWRFELALKAGWSAAAEARVQLDDSTEIGYASAAEGKKKANTNLYRSISGHYVAALSGVHNIDIDYRSMDSGDVSGIRRVRIELWRVN